MYLFHNYEKDTHHVLFTKYFPLCFFLIYILYRSALSSRRYEREYKCQFTEFEIRQQIE